MKVEMKEKQPGKLLNIRLLFVLVTLAEIIGTLLLSALLSALSQYLLNRVIEVHPILWLLFFSITIGLAASVVVNIILLKPVVTLSKAMKQVAAGDFSVRLRSRSRIREIRNSFDSFNLMAQELEATETLQTDFVSNVSHEFKTPINAIEGYATLLQGVSGDAQQRGYVDRILLNTRRLSTLVGNILLLSKVSNHAIPIAKNTYRLDEQIRQSILLLEPRWTEKNVEFDVDMDELTWTGPESLMHHVWSNLISNAIKFGPEEDLIRITLKQTDGRFVFAIEDGGPGIPDEDQRHIFNKFYQLDSSHKQEGNGLGLALCKQIICSCNGEISVMNLPKRGCRFIVTLPAV